VVANNFARSREVKMRDRQRKKLRLNSKQLRETLAASAVTFCLAALVYGEDPFRLGAKEKAMQTL